MPVGDFDDLLAANPTTPTVRHEGFDGIAHAGVAIVTCMDSRIAPLQMVGLKPGDAKIFRNPGGRVTPQALEALVLGPPPAERRADPGRPAHPLRHGLEHRGRAPRAHQRRHRRRLELAALQRRPRPGRGPRGGRAQGAHATR